MSDLLLHAAQLAHEAVLHDAERVAAEVCSLLYK